jgi:hypothetical protein
MPDNEMSCPESLAALQARIAGIVDDVSCRGSGASAFLYAEHAGRAIEVSCDSGRWWIEFWDREEDDDAPPVHELWATSDDEAYQAIQEWLRPRVSAGKQP